MADRYVVQTLVAVLVPLVGVAVVTAVYPVVELAHVPTALSGPHT